MVYSYFYAEARCVHAHSVARTARAQTPMSDLLPTITLTVGISISINISITITFTIAITITITINVATITKRAALLADGSSEAQRFCALACIIISFNY